MMFFLFGDISCLIFVGIDGSYDISGVESVSEFLSLNCLDGK